MVLECQPVTLDVVGSSPIFLDRFELLVSWYNVSAIKGKYAGSTPTEFHLLIVGV